MPNLKISQLPEASASDLAGSESLEIVLGGANYRLELDTLAAWLNTASGGASTTQPDEMMAGYIGSPSAKDYRIVVKAAHGGTITETTTRSESGTGTVTFKINTTALGGTANSASSSEQSQSHSSSNAFSAGDDIVITLSSLSSLVGLSFSIKYTRVLA